MKQMHATEDKISLENKNACLMKLALILRMSISLLENTKVSPCKCYPNTQKMNNYFIFFLEKM